MKKNTYLRRDEVNRIIVEEDWKNIVYSEFEMALSSAIRPFPCIFGVQGFKGDQLRYYFQEQFNAIDFVRILRDFVRDCRSFGQNTSLVLFLKPSEIASIDYYRNQFWSILTELHSLDFDPWPSDVPKELESKDWEFCFAGEPIFVVCNNPAHVLRQSRRSTGMMLTFQPRWVFNKILGTEKAASKAFASVRERLAKYDLIAQSPALGRYGDDTVREYQQYFLDERNDISACPFHELNSKKSMVSA